MTCSRSVVRHHRGHPNAQASEASDRTVQKPHGRGLNSYRREVGGTSSTCRRAQQQRRTIRATVARADRGGPTISPQVRRWRRSTSIRRTVASGVACGLRRGRELRSVSGSPAPGALHPLPNGALADSGHAADLAPSSPAAAPGGNFCSTMRRQSGNSLTSVARGGAFGQDRPALRAALPALLTDNHDAIG
jgi:hypothetical protein